MTIVLLSWYFFKHSLASDRQSPYQRGIYEDMFYNMATKYPQLWARTGPRDAIKPQTRLDRIRWRLVLFWNDPAKTIRKSPGNDTGYDDLGAWARCKRYLTSRWTKQLRNYEDVSSSLTALEDGTQADAASVPEEKPDPHVAEAHITYSTPIAPENRLEVPLSTIGSQTPVGFQSRTSVSKPSSAPGQRPGSRRSRSSGRTSAIMVEEEPATWLHDYRFPAVSNATV